MKTTRVRVAMVRVREDHLAVARPCRARESTRRLVPRDLRLLPEARLLVERQRARAWLGFGFGFGFGFGLGLGLGLGQRERAGAAAAGHRQQRAARAGEARGGPQ